MSELEGCPHCGSKTRHKKNCPDQQIINAYKDLNCARARM